MAHPEFKHCDKYGLIRNYKMETDFMITAAQVEEVLEVLDSRLTHLEALIGFQEKLLRKCGVSGLDKLLKPVEVLTLDEAPSE